MASSLRLGLRSSRPLSRCLVSSPSQPAARLVRPALGSSSSSSRVPTTTTTTTTTAWLRRRSYATSHAAAAAPDNKHAAEAGSSSGGADHGHDHGHDDHYDPPGGWLWGVRPGEKYEKEGWEGIFTWFYIVPIVVATIFYVNKEDTTIQTWALEEARRRLEKEGLLTADSSGSLSSKPTET